MAFELFDQKGANMSAKTIATINKYNVLILNAATTRIYKIQEYNFANIYYDKETMKIGFKFLHDMEESSFKLTAAKNHYTIYISLTSFLKYHNLKLKETRKYLMIKDDESGLYVFDISKPLKTPLRKKKTPKIGQPV